MILGLNMLALVGKAFVGGIAGLFGLAFVVTLGLGELYWLWMAIQFGSFWMFVLGLFPFTAMICAPVGMWSLLFGVPHWVLSWFVLPS